MARAFFFIIALLLCSSITADSLLECRGGSFAKPEATFSRVRVAQVALQEFQWWRGRDESDGGVRSRLESYWLNAGFSRWSARDSIRRGAHWSAVFVSNVMRLAGAGEAFAYSSVHTTYCAAAKRNRGCYATSNPFWLFDAKDFAPRVGDLICKNRDSSGVNFENVDDGLPRASHCDVVIQKRGNVLRTIGGNVFDTVGEKFVPTDSNGRVGSSWYAVLAVRDNATP
jgi:hypothetical protein